MQEPLARPPKVGPGIVTVPPTPRVEPDLTNLYRELLSPVTYLTESTTTVRPSGIAATVPLIRIMGEPSTSRLNPAETHSRWEQFQAIMGTVNQGPNQNALPGEASNVCGPSDILGMITWQNLPAPPNAISQFVAQIQPDPCNDSTDCSSWDYFCNSVTRRFKQMLKYGKFSPDEFEDDTGGQWSREGSTLWGMAQEAPPASQTLGQTYLSRTLYNKQSK